MSVKWPKKKDPEHCYHGHLESIELFCHDIPENGSLIPSFVCTKCFAVLFLRKDTTTGHITALTSLDDRE